MPDQRHLPRHSPVCDATSHACRTCSKDSECDSGACDLAAGTCVGRTAILYASPGGSAAAPCTAAAPCSLRRAAELVDASHTYVVLEPGQYTSGADFDNQVATIVGNGATIVNTGLTSSFVHLGNRSSIAMRDIKLGDTFTERPTDGGAVIGVTSSELTIDNLSATSFFDSVIASGSNSTLTIRTSAFTNTTISAGSTVNDRLFIDRCRFLAGGPRLAGSIVMTNSIVVTSGTELAIAIGDGAPLTTNEISNNTFVGGRVSCQESGGTFRRFNANIFYNHKGITSSTNCTYNYNLFVPIEDPEGQGNTTGDPLFVDAANQDFHLQNGSPAIDAAGPAPSMGGHDFDGVARPQGTRADIGAFEFVPASE